MEKAILPAATKELPNGSLKSNLFGASISLKRKSQKDWQTEGNTQETKYPRQNIFQKSNSCIVCLRETLPKVMLPASKPLIPILKTNFSRCTGRLWQDPWHGVDREEMLRKKERKQERINTWFPETPAMKPAMFGSLTQLQKLWLFYGVPDASVRLPGKGTRYYPRM